MAFGVVHDRDRRRLPRLALRLPLMMLGRAFARAAAAAPPAPASPTFSSSFYSSCLGLARLKRRFGTSLDRLSALDFLGLALRPAGAAVAIAALGATAAFAIPSALTLAATSALASLSALSASAALTAAATATAFASTSATASLLAVAQLASRPRHHAHLVGPRADSEKAARAFFHHRDHHFGPRESESVEPLPHRVIEGLALEGNSLRIHL
jgi:hypothetical protein